MKHRLSWLAVAVAAALAVVGAWSLHPHAAPAANSRDRAAATRAQPVSIGVVQQRDMPVRVDPRPFEIALEQAQGQLARDEAQLRNAQVDLQRYRDLIAKDAAPKQQLDTQLALVQQLRGTVLADRAAADNAKLQLSYTRVIAPISGLAGLKQVDVGIVVNPSDANGLLNVTQTQPVAVVFAVPDAVLPRVRRQLAAGVPLRVEAWHRDGTTLLAEGRVASNDNAIDASTDTVRLKALFANADDRLFPTQPVHVRLQIDTLPAALTVPSAAVQRGAAGACVFALNGDGTVPRSPVRSSTAARGAKPRSRRAPRPNRRRRRTGRRCSARCRKSRTTSPRWRSSAPSSSCSRPRCRPRSATGNSCRTSTAPAR